MTSKKKSRARVISPQPFFSPRGTPFSVYYRTLVTSQLGVDIDLLTYGEGQDAELPGVRIVRIPRFRFLGPVKIGPSFLKLFLDGFLFLWTVALMIRNRYDFVHAHEEAIFFCRLLKPIFGFKLVYDMHSSLPQQLTNFQFTRSKTLIRIFKNLEESSLRASDAIITICPELADYVDRQIEPNGRHVLIENSIFEPVKLKTRASCASRADCGADVETVTLIRSGGPLVVYAGTLEPYQGIDLLIGSWRHVIRKRPDALLLIVGGTPDQVAAYRAQTKSAGVADAVQLTGRVPQHVARQWIEKAAVLVSPRIHGTNTPLKIYEQIASGIPLVATAIYSHTQVLNDEVAFLVEPEPDHVAQGILKALESKEDRKRVVANALKLYQAKYSRPVYETKLKTVIERVR